MSQVMRFFLSPRLRDISLCISPNTLESTDYVKRIRLHPNKLYPTFRMNVMSLRIFMLGRTETRAPLSIADVGNSKRPLLFTVWTQLRLRSHQNVYENFTRKQFLPTSGGNAQAQLQFCG